MVVIGVLALLVAVVTYLRPITPVAKPNIDANDSSVTVTQTDGHVPFLVIGEIVRLEIGSRGVPAPEKYFKRQEGNLGGENTQPVRIPIQRFYEETGFNDLLKARVLQSAKYGRFTTQQTIYVEVLITVKRFRRFSKAFVRKRVCYESTASSIGMGQKPAIEYTERDFTISVGMTQLVNGQPH